MNKKESEQKDTYVATMVHDLKNPLIAHGRILERIIKKTNDSLTKEYCQQMLTSTRLTLEMVSSITETYRLNSGKIKYIYEKINLFDLTKEVCNELAAHTEDEKLIKIDVSGVPIVYADKLHIRRVVSNLISNSIKYKKDGSNIFIKIGGYLDDVHFTVSNQGRYIPPENQKELFSKFVSKNAKFNSRSTGLGLYLAEQIIKAHSGKMLVNSSIQGINTFGFSIPANLQPKIQGKSFFLLDVCKRFIK